jgi:hypothetical protein
MPFSIVLYKRDCANFNTHSLFTLYLYIMDFILELIGLYLLYKLVFDFIIPITETTKQVKRQFSDMQNKMHEQSRQFEQHSKNQQSTFTSPTQKPASEDYIEFEEVK